jgi:hypothetical protein
VGGILVLFCFIALVALDAALLEVLVCLDKLAVDEETKVVSLRLDRRRRPSSPFALALRHHEGLAGLFEQGLVGVAGHTAAGVIGGAR